MSVFEIPLSAIAPSTLNPRKQTNTSELESLAASVIQKGVLEPVLLRPIPKKNGYEYEMVCGSRRFAAAALAKKDTIPAVVREMTDQEAMEAQIVENLHRADLHYLDEAQGFQALLDRGQSQEDIAAKVGKPLGYVASRLSLHRLVKSYHKYALAGDLPVSVALRLSRLTATIQKAYFEEHCKESDQEDYDIADAFHMGNLDHWLHGYVYLNLAKAAFDPASAQLVPKAGSCLLCPKRTGTNLLLFPEFTAQGADNICTDPSCYESKAKALIQIREKEHPEAIKIVVSDDLTEAQQKQAEKQNYLAPYSYWNTEKGYRSSTKDACQDTKLAIVVMGAPNQVGSTMHVCTAKECKTHTGSRRITSPREPGVMDPERVKQQDELWKRRTARACRLGLHEALRQRQDEYLKAIPPAAALAHVMPPDALRFAVTKACEALRPQKDGSEYLESVWLPKRKKEGIGWGGRNLFPLFKEADHATLLRLLLDFAIADNIANKHNTEKKLVGEVAEAYGLKVDKVLAPVLAEWDAKRLASIEKRKTRLANERKKAPRTKARAPGSLRDLYT